MGAFLRAVCYLRRRWVRSTLLLLCFFLLSILVLIAASLLRGAGQIQAAMKERAGSKVVIEQPGGFSTKDIQVLSEMEGVLWINRFAEVVAVPTNFLPVLGSDEKTEVTLHAWDALFADGSFAQEQYRLQAGDDTAIVVNVDLGRSIGEELTFQDSSGRIAQGQVTGLYTTGQERLQPDSLSSKNRLENQIFVPMELLEKLNAELQYQSVAVYTADPQVIAEKMADLLPSVTGITSDVLLQRVTAPVHQTIEMASFLLAVIALASGILLCMLLTLWMRTRIREFGIFCSMGIPARCILAQVGMESGILFGMGACLGGGCLCAYMPLGMVSLLQGSAYSMLAGIRLETSEFIWVLAAGFVLVGVCAGIAVFPCILRRPRELLSRMEE